MGGRDGDSRTPGTGALVALGAGKVTLTHPDFPILGEPLGIELANTWYGSDDDAIDFLANPQHAAGCASVALLVDAHGQASSAVRFRGNAAVRARLATSCVEVLTGPHPIHRCEGEGCSLFFVQQHGRRRFCHDGCSHRARQQRYRRTLS